MIIHKRTTRGTSNGILRYSVMNFIYAGCMIVVIDSEDFVVTDKICPLRQALETVNCCAFLKRRLIGAC
jgi:hypothetical protein